MMLALPPHQITRQEVIDVVERHFDIIHLDWLEDGSLVQNGRGIKVMNAHGFVNTIDDEKPPFIGNAK